LFKYSISIYLIDESPDMSLAGRLGDPVLAQSNNPKITRNKGKRKE
jgi:hypothetical protein